MGARDCNSESASQGGKPCWRSDTTSRSIAAVPNGAGTYNRTREKIGNNFRTAKHCSVAGRQSFVREAGLVPPLAWRPNCPTVSRVRYFELLAPQETIAV